MPVIKPTCIRDLKLRVNIADVVSRVVTLRKAGGARLKGLCPFHHEKTPSFHVDSDKGFYKCFGCGKAGDAITFVRETEQLNFTEAVEALGKRFGIVIEYEEGSGGPSHEERSLRQELFDLHDVAAEHFFQAFKAKDPTGDFFRNYWLEKRRFPMEIADEFKIGSVDEGGSGLGALLLRRKYSEEALRRCGLFFIYDDAQITLGALRPRFRGRLMIPIRDHQGRVVAFTARQTDKTPPDDPAREAKYVNSPETPIFIKGNLLFNLDRARTAVGEGKPFVLVEGQLDALRCWSVGLKTAIAPQGTSITESQLLLLRRYHPQVECFFDSDAAGQKAALRFLPMALKAGLEARFLTLAGVEKLDPDLLFLERGLSAYDEVRRSARSAMAFACAAILPTPSIASPEQKGRAALSVFELINASESEFLRAQFLTEVSNYLTIPVSSLQSDYLLFTRRGSGTRIDRSNGQAAPPLPPSEVQLAASKSPEEDILRVSLRFEEIISSIHQQLPHEWIDTGHLAGRLLNRLFSELENGPWPGRDNLGALLEDDEERALVASLVFESSAIDDPVPVATMALTKLRNRALEPQIRQIELSIADGVGDLGALVKKRLDLSRQIRVPVKLVPPVG